MIRAESDELKKEGITVLGWVLGHAPTTITLAVQLPGGKMKMKPIRSPLSFSPTRRTAKAALLVGTGLSMAA